MDTYGPSDDSSVVVELQSLLLGAERVEEFLADVARRAAGTVEHAQSCGLTVQATVRSRFLGASSDEFGRRMDHVQYAVDDGPCLHCLRTATPVQVDDITNDQRWPAFGLRGQHEGAGSSLSIPLIIHEKAVGVLNLYSRTAYGLDATDRQRALQFADQAAGAVGLALRLAEREERERHLETALTSRTTIDQAIGVLMGRAGISATEAFDALRVRSQHTNTKLRDVAAGILAELNGGEE